MNYILWEQIWIPRQCALDRIDVFHSPVHFGLPQVIRAKCVLTLHDVTEEHYRVKEEKMNNIKRLTFLMARMARRRADHILTVSEYSRNELIRHFRFPENKVTVTYEAADRRFHEPIPPEVRKHVRDKYQLPAHYLFYVGSLERRKNIPFLFKAFAIAGLDDWNIVIGGGNQVHRGALMEVASSLHIEGQVSMIGRVSDEDLPALYAEAQAYVYPSEFEGFGLQVCEGLAAGCPVLVADATSLPEVLADGGDIFTLSNPNQLAQLLIRLHNDVDYKADLLRRGHLRSQFFSWRRTAQQTLAVYKMLCASRS
jgi:glycosyltransferase involved in cell wall biosynthesis